MLTMVLDEIDSCFYFEYNYDDDFYIEVDSIVQGDDEPTGHNDGRDTQLPPSIPAVHPVQLHSHN